MSHDTPAGPSLSDARAAEATTLAPEAWGWHLLGLITPLVATGCNLVGGPWVAGVIVYLFVVAPLLDLALGRAEPVRPPRSSGLPFEVLLYVHAVLHFVALGTLLWRAGVDGSAWTTWIAAVSTGLSSGASGIVVAHELGHRRPGSFAWWVGRANLLTVLYLHFTTEHNHTHHRLVGTPDDPATARRGEPLPRFIARSVTGQLRDALRVHASRGRTGMRNPVVRGLLAQLGLVLALLVLAGPWVTAAFVAQAATAVWVLEYVNYIRHYGLARARSERQTEMHSWQAEERFSRWTLLELTRHPAHHLKASLPFWQLRPYPDAPTLPTGYYGCFWLALIPPLWRRVMDPRIPPVNGDPAIPRSGSGPG